MQRLSGIEYLFFSPTFQVLLKYENNSRGVWSQTGNQGNKWRRGEVFLGLLNNFQVCKTQTGSYKYNSRVNTGYLLWESRTVNSSLIKTIDICSEQKGSISDDRSSIKSA